MPLTSWSLPCAPPRMATPRDPSAPTDGPAVAVLAAALGRPLLAWQRYVADVAGERTLDGRYRYPVVVLTVPRQSGKTVLLRCVGVHRAARNPRRGVFYTAQTGKDARRRWEDMIGDVEASPLSGHVTVRRRAGSEALLLPNGSEFGVFSPKRDALHGETPDLVMIDEAWKHTPELGEDLMSAIRPAMITVPHRQLWIVSTAGDEQSTWFRSWVETGRAAAEGIAHFEWSAPDDAPRDDPAVWAAHHPTYGELITDEDLRENLTLADFDRAYLNRWPDNAAATVIPMPAFDARHDEHQGLPEPGALSLGFDVGEDRRDAAIVAAWTDRNGIERTSLVDYAGGASWLPDRLAELRARWNPRSVGYDDHGPAVAVADQLTRDGWELNPVSGRDYATACGSWLASIVDARTGHDAGPSSPMRTAAKHARSRRVGDVWVWDRRNPGPETPTPTPVIAATVAQWSDAHHVPDTPIPKAHIVV